MRAGLVTSAALRSWDSTVSSLRRSPIVALLAGSLCIASSVNAVAAQVPSQQDERSKAPALDVNKYGKQLEQFLSSEIVPKLSRAIVASAKTRPRSMQVQLVYDASPYRSKAVVRDRQLLVTLTLGYVLAHDAALDGAGLSAMFNQPDVLERYLSYQISAARENERRRTSNGARERTATYAEFASLPPGVVRSTFSDTQWHAQRRAAQEASLGWVIAYLLVSADPSLAAPHDDPAVGAARLAAAAGWFPVPPLATALGWAEYSTGAPQTGDAREVWCRAVTPMDQGVETARTTSSSQGTSEPQAERQIAFVELQIAKIKQRNRCGSRSGSKPDVSA